MNNNTKVSIIMPVYNAVHYIDIAITSILNQTYPNFELIIIDDGATDGTSEICQKYCNQDNRIKYIRQTNKGICKARNTGLELATGEYIAFSDHDDKYEPNYIELMLNKAQEENLDIVKCGVYFEETFANGNQKTTIENFKEEVLSKKELIQKYISLPMAFWGVWNSLYRASLLHTNHIKFQESIYHGQEDYYFNTELIPHIYRIGFIKECLYRHYRRLSQSTSAKFYEDRLDAMSLYYRLESKILKPFFKEKDWANILSIIYAQKITGILSYCFNTSNSQRELKALLAIKKFTNENPFKYSITCLPYLLKEKKIKYFLILYLVDHRYFNLLFYLWKLKNK